MDNRSPYPWFGGKRTVAGEIWRRLGDPMNFVDPFLGSNAILLARPGWDWQAGDWRDGRGRDNRELETIWFSKHCLDVEAAQQGNLFDSKGENHGEKTEL